MSKPHRAHAVRFDAKVIMAAQTAICAALLLAAPLKAAPPAPDILHYTFEGSGSSVINHASAPPVGTATGMIVGTALSQGALLNTVTSALNGTGGIANTNYIDTGWATHLAGSWTISFFAKNIPTDTANYYVFGDETADSFRCFVVNGQVWQLVGGNYVYDDVAIFAPADGGLHMITYTFNQPNGRTVGYLDGVLNATHAAPPVIITGAGPFTVGAYRGSQGSAGLKGQLADFRIYSRALNPAELRNLYAYVTTNGDAIFRDNFEQ